MKLTFQTAANPRFCGYRALIVMAICLMSLNANSVQAALLTYTSQGAFATASVGRTTTEVLFDSNPDGTVVSPGVIPNLIFDAANEVTGSVIITNGSVGFSPGLKTFSGTRYLGSNIGDVINEDFTFSFQTPVNGAGLYIISASELSVGDIGIRVGATTVFNALVEPANVLSGGGTLVDSYAYFVGIADDNPLATFSSVRVVQNPALSFPVDIGIDNLSYTVTAIPEPGTILLASGALVGFALLRRRHLRTFQK